MTRAVYRHSTLRSNPNVAREGVQRGADGLEVHADIWLCDGEPAAAAAELRMAAAPKLFELGRLSSGAVAELAGIPLRSALRTESARSRTAREALLE